MIQTTHMTMTVQEWSEIPDNPIQRDTIAHAKKAKTKHLKIASATHSRVSACRLSTGETYKLDGHTRSYLWGTRELAAPDYVNVDMYLVENMQQVEDLYKQFDNAHAAETASDRLSGAFRLHGLKPESPLLLFGGVTSAIRVATAANSSMNIYTAIAPWMEALDMIDKEGFSNSSFPTGVLAGTLMTVRARGYETMPFWRAYANDEGTKDGRERDGVQALADLVRDRRLQGTTAGFANLQDIASKSVSACLAYMRGTKYTVGIKSTDLRKFAKEFFREGTAA